MPDEARCWMRRAFLQLQRFWTFILSLAIFTNPRPALPIVHQKATRAAHLVSRPLQLKDELNSTDVAAGFEAPRLPERSTFLTVEQRRERRLAKIPVFKPPPEIVLEDFGEEELPTGSDLPRLIITPSTPSPNRRASVFSQHNSYRITLPAETFEEAFRATVIETPVPLGEYIAQVVCPVEDSLDKSASASIHGNTFVFTDSLTEITFGRRSFPSVTEELPIRPKSPALGNGDGPMQDSDQSLPLSDRSRFTITYEHRASASYAELFDFGMYTDLRASFTSPRIFSGVSPRTERSNSCSAASESHTGHVNSSITPPPPYLFIDPAMPLNPARGFDPEILPPDQSHDSNIPLDILANPSSQQFSSPNDVRRSHSLTVERPGNPVVPFSPPNSEDLPSTSVPLLEARGFASPSTEPEVEGQNQHHQPSMYPPQCLGFLHGQPNCVHNIREAPNSRMSSPTLPFLDEDARSPHVGSPQTFSPREPLGGFRYTLQWMASPGEGSSGRTPPTPTPIRPLRAKKTRSKSKADPVTFQPLDMSSPAQGYSPSSMVSSAAEAKPRQAPEQLGAREPSAVPSTTPPLSGSAVEDQARPLRVVNGSPSTGSSEGQEAAEGTLGATFDEPEVSFTTAMSTSSSIIALQSAILKGSLPRRRSQSYSAVISRHSLPTIAEEIYTLDRAFGLALLEEQNSQHRTSHTHLRSSSSTSTIRGKTSLFLARLNGRRSGIFSTSTISTGRDFSFEVYDELGRRASLAQAPAPQIP